MARSVPIPAHHVPGDPITAGIWNGGPKALGDFLGNRPAFHGVSTASSSVPSGLWVAVAIDSAYIDTDGGHNNVLTNARYFCQVPGWYWVTGCIAWNGVSATVLNRSDAALAKNGTIWVGSATFLDWGGTTSLVQGAFSTSALIPLSVGDYIEVWGRQGSGVNQSLDQGSSFARAYCQLSALWIHS